MADMIGQSLGSYRIESRLGAGGMGEVYRAVHARLNRPAAIKILHANEAADPTFQARFLREARAAAALSHPNIVEVFDFGEQDGLSYLVMELVPDGSLRTLLQQRSTGQGWTLGMGVHLVRQAAEGLAYAHEHGMVHRDIKPDNLLLQRRAPADRAETYQLKISDFGLARLMDDGGELTVTGMVMGTPTYMSPEQCQGSDLDGRSDLYSLGVVLYEVATGSPPFRVKTLSEAVFKHISAPPTPPRALQPDLPDALEEVILRCLEKNPDDRFASGTELAEALDGALGGTDLQTVVAPRYARPPVTPPPVAPVDDTPPTVADSRPERRTPVPPVRSRGATNPALSGLSGMHDEATVQVSGADMSSSRIERRRAALSRDRSTGKPPVWVPPADGAQSNSGNGFVAALRARPKALAIGGAALAIVLVLILGVGALRSAANAGKQGTPVARATATTAATATPADKITFTDSMSTSSARWPRSARSYFNAGGYEINGAWLVFAPTGTTNDVLKNGSVSVRLRQVSGVSDQFYGIVVRALNNQTYYVFGVTQSQQWAFILVTNGNHKFVVAPTTDTHLKPGLNANNTLKVRMQGGHFDFFVNGVQVGQANDGTIAAGKAGIVNIVSGLAVIYNDFTVAVLP